MTEASADSGRSEEAPPSRHPEHPGSGDTLRILVVNWLDRENPLSGGAETHLHETFGRMARAGHHVTLLCSGWPGCEPRAELDGLRVHRVGRRYTFSLHARRYFQRQLANPGFDVIVEDLNKVPLFTPRWSATPVVLLVHHLFGRTAFQEANPLIAAATWLLERPIPLFFRGIRTVAISESTKVDLGRRGLPLQNVTVIPNGVDVDAYRSIPGEDPFPSPTIVFVGRVKRYKCVDLVLEAVALLRERGRDVRLLVAGRGDHLGELERLRDRLDLGDRVEFLGFIEEERKRELLRRAWVHVLTSPKEGWGIANVEAAASGTPTVASDSPGLRESVLHGETGFLVPHGDVTALAEHLDLLLRDAELRSSMGRASRAFATRFSWDASAEALANVLRAEAGRVKR